MNTSEANGQIRTLLFSRSKTTRSSCAELDTLYNNPRHKKGTELVGEKETHCEKYIPCHLQSSPLLGGGGGNSLGIFIIECYWNKQINKATCVSLRYRYNEKKKTLNTQNPRNQHPNPITMSKKKQFQKTTFLGNIIVCMCTSGSEVSDQGNWIIQAEKETYNQKPNYQLCATYARSVVVFYILCYLETCI